MTQQPGKAPGKVPGTVRRPPRFAPFLITGGIVGLLIGFLVSVLGHPDTRYDASAAVGFLGLVCAGLGVMVGGIIAVLLDRTR